jgi:hypothetical protein
VSSAITSSARWVIRRRYEQRSHASGRMTAGTRHRSGRRWPNDVSCNRLHIVAQGKVRIFKTSVSGHEQVLAVNVRGESVAELPVLDGGLFPALPQRLRMQKLRSFHAELSGVLHGASRSRVQGASGRRSAVAATSGYYRGVVVHDSPPTTHIGTVQTCPKRGQTGFSRNRVSTAGNLSGTRQSAWNGTRTGFPQLYALAGRGTSGC